MVCIYLDNQHGYSYEVCKQRSVFTHSTKKERFLKRKSVVSEGVTVGRKGRCSLMFATKVFKNGAGNSLQVQTTLIY